MASKLKDYVVEVDGRKRIRRLSDDHKARVEKRVKKAGGAVTQKADEERKLRREARNKQRTAASSK